MPIELVTVILVVVAALLAWLGWLWLRRAPVHKQTLVTVDLARHLAHINTPNGAGALGETTLELCLSDLDYRLNKDFYLQKRIVAPWLQQSGGIVDCQLTLSDELRVIFDSKLPGMKELTAQLLDNDSSPIETARAIAKKVRDRIKALELKGYTRMERDTFPRLLMFIASDAAYAAAQSADSGLLAYAEQNKIVLVCPGTLAGALAAVKVAAGAGTRDATVGDVHHAATVIGKSVTEVHERFSKTFRHLDALAKDYDELAKCVNKQILPSLRRLDELGVDVKELNDLAGVDHAGLAVTEVGAP